MKNTKIEIDKCEFLNELVARMQRAGIEYDDAGCVCYLIMDIWNELENPQKITTAFDPENIF